MSYKRKATRRPTFTSCMTKPYFIPYPISWLFNEVTKLRFKWIFKEAKEGAGLHELIWQHGSSAEGKGSGAGKRQRESERKRESEEREGMEGRGRQEGERIYRRKKAPPFNTPTAPPITTPRHMWRTMNAPRTQNCDSWEVYRDLLGGNEEDTG